MHSLPLFVRLNGRPVILVGEGEAAEAKARLLRRAGAQIVGEEAEAALAIVALDDNAAALAAIARLKERGILVNAVDRRSEEHTSELQSLMRISYAVFCLKQKKTHIKRHN